MFRIVKRFIDKHLEVLKKVLIVASAVASVVLLIAFVVLGPSIFEFDDYGTNVYTELFGVLLSVFISVVIIGGWTEYRLTRQLRERLKREARSRSRDIAISAIESLRDKGWIFGEKSLLSGMDMSDVNLQNVVMPYSNLTWVNFTRTNLRDATLIRADLRHAIFRGTDLSGAKLSGAKLQGACMEFTILKGAFLERAEMQGNNLLLSKLQGSDMRGACLEGTKMWATNLEGVNMRAANLKRADLRGAYLTGATLPNQEKLEGTILPDGKIFSANCDYEELDRFTDPEHSRFDNAFKDAEDFRQDKRLHWNEITQPFRVEYMPPLW